MIHTHLLVRGPLGRTVLEECLGRRELRDAFSERALLADEFPQAEVAMHYFPSDSACPFGAESHEAFAVVEQDGHYVAYALTTSA